MCNHTYRIATEEDTDFLWEMLYQAIYVQEGEVRPSKDILNNPELQRCLSGWGREGDLAILSVDSSSNNPFGAVWVRLFDESNRIYGYVGKGVPVLGMAILPEYRGQGIGTVLIEKMLKTCKELGYQSISLSVDPNNPALRLYERQGFKKVGVAGTSWDMVANI